MSNSRRRRAILRKNVASAREDKKTVRKHQQIPKFSFLRPFPGFEPQGKKGDAQPDDLNEGNEAEANAEAEQASNG